MSETPPESRQSLSPVKIVLMILLPILAVVMMVVVLLSLFFGVKPAEAPPLPAGQAEIHVAFQGLSTDEFNALSQFLGDLAREQSEGNSREAASYHSFWNNGYAYERYQPNHPVPSPEVEAALKARFDAFLEENGIDGKGESLDLRYGS